MSEEKETIESSGRSVDMLHGPMAKKIFLFALPIAASSILQQLFNSADVAVVGHFAEEGALAAVGSNTVLVGLFVNIFTGLSVGANVAISHYIGQRREQEVGRVVHTSVLFSVICGIVMMFTGLILSRSLLEWMNAPADVLDRAVLYLRIYCIGMPFIIPYNFGAAILRSIGDTKRPMYCLIASGIMNVLLNLLLVIGFHMGVAGVAIATVTSNIFSTIAVFLILIHEEGAIHLNLRELRIESTALKQIIQIGAPAALQSAMFSLSNICLQTAINSFGSKAVAGMTAAVNFEFFAFYIINAFSQSAVTFVGQNYGAGKYDRCRKTLRLCMLEGVVGTVLLSAAFVLCRGFLMRIYTVDPQEIEYAMMRLLCIIPFIFIANSYEITGSALRGMGRSMVPALFTMIGSVVFRVIWVYVVFERWHSFYTLMIVYPISWILTGGMVVTYYFLCRRRLEADVRQAAI